ncbi:MAG: alpha/beta hydrolase [Patescibacteria group bacterium]
MTTSTALSNPPLLASTVRGRGPVVVLLHGFLSSSEYWRRVADISEADHTVVALDLLGFGASPKPRKSRYDYDAHIASIDATLKQLGISDGFTLVGHSMGSLIALRYARLNKDKVGKLVLVNMPVMLGKRQVREEIGGTSFAYRYGLQPYTHRFAWSIFKALFRLRLLSRSTIRRLKENSYFFEHSPLSRIRSFQRVIADARADIDLNLVRVETLILSGLEDRKVYLDNILHNISLSPTVAVETVPTGHHIPCAMPSVLARKLSE